MKRFCLFVVIMLFTLVSVRAQEQPIDRSLYVVIGAFAVKDNAIGFTAQAKKRGYPAEYFMSNTARKLYYVYILHTDDRLAAISEAVKLQKQPQSPYPDTWVYTGLHSTPEIVNIKDKEQAEALERLEAMKNATKPDSSYYGKSKPFLFRVTALSDGDTLPADINIYDSDAIKRRKDATYRANDVVQVKPINKSGNMTLVSEIFGYRKLELPVNFFTPETSEGVTIESEVVIVSFPMVRLQKGDIATMYNLYFFNDAAIMRPESLSEVNSLVEMMQENPNYRIRIHGHTNGNAYGKITYMGESKSFFSFSDSNKKGRGSAVKLSEERAKLILQYLVEKGIPADRMEIKGWGGSKPIYETDHILARINIRVEIEILED